MSWKRQPLALMTGLLTVVVLAGCRRQTATSPPPIRYGEDVCTFCQMTIDDPRFAAALIYRAPGGSQRVAIFDDIGCMLAWQREHLDNYTIAAFVHDYRNRRWVNAVDARYVKSSAIQTPMGWGIAAGVSEVDAKAAAPGSGLKAMGYYELRSTEQNREGAAK